MAESKHSAFDEPWSAHTVVEGSELEEHIIEADMKEKGKISAHNFCIEMDGGAFNISNLMDFVEEKFPYFVLNREEVQDADYPFKTALDRVDYRRLSWQDGTYGEMLLFLLVDGILDIPMICHKITLSVDPRDNVKGSDGIFFGSYRGDEALALGEAKMISNLEDGIDDALESSYRFHGERARLERKNDLLVASKNLSENLSQEKIKYLADRLVEDPDGFPYMHPMFIAFESEVAAEIPKKDRDPDQLKEEVIDEVKKIDKRRYIDDEIGGSYDTLAHHHLVFLFLPVADVSELRDRMKNTIFPHSTLHE